VSVTFRWIDHSDEGRLPNIVFAALISEMDRQGMIGDSTGMPLTPLVEGGRLSPKQIRNGLRSADSDYVLPPDHEIVRPVEEAFLASGYPFVNVGREMLLRMAPEEWLGFWRDWLRFLEGGAEHGGVSIDR